MGNDFTIKEIVIETNNTLAKLAEEIRENQKAMDSRVDNLEKHQSSVVTVFKVFSWLGGFSVAIFTTLKLLQII